MDYGYNDNVSYQPHSSDAIGSSFQSAAPVLSMIGERGQDKYLLMYSGDYRNYSSDSADNYNDHFSVLTVRRYGLKHGLTSIWRIRLGMNPVVAVLPRVFSRANSSSMGLHLH